MEVLNLNTFREKVLRRAETKSAIEIDIIDFFAPWCQPCIRFSPVFEKYAEEFKSQANFYKIDIQDTPEVAMDFSVLSIPTLIVFKGGEEVQRKVGSLSEIDFRMWINSVLRSSGPTL